MKRKTLLVGLGLVPLMAVSGCIKTDKMAGRWIYTHPIPNCWTSIDVPGNGKDEDWEFMMQTNVLGVTTPSRAER